MHASGYERWISRFVLVAFDVNEGQKVSAIVPNQHLSQTQEKELAMLAFPDSNSLNSFEDTFKYIFKTTHDLFGFVCFRQKKEERNPRGYSQQSFIILTKLPFIAFFQKMADFLVFKLLNLELEKILMELETVIQQMNKWPDPSPSNSYILPILNYEISIEVPNYLADQSNRNVDISNGVYPEKNCVSLEDIVTKESLLRYGCFQEVKLTDQFSKCYETLWEIWEASMLNRAILLIGENPYQVSQAVLGAISLVNPLDYGGQFSPYLTVYDPHLEELLKTEQNYILGATNPLFLKLFNQKKIKIIVLKNASSTQKYLRPVKELCIPCSSEEQKAFQQSSLRKYFYRLNKSVISLLNQYFDQQYNDLKLYSQKDFIRFLKAKSSFDMLDHAFISRRAAFAFMEEFTGSKNFDLLLLRRNVFREKV